MEINRNQLINEKVLRQHIREAITIVKARRKVVEMKRLREEKDLRSIIRQLLTEAGTPDSEESPHESTGINVLKDLLKKIIPIIEIDFKKLTTDKMQRDSFRAHVITAIENVLIPPKVTDAAQAGGDSMDLREQEEEKETITMNIEDDPDYIPIGTEKKDKKAKDADEKEEFGIEGEDETGRDMAFNTIKKIQGNILDSWEPLHTTEDKELFFDYLVTNVKLHLDKFEDDIQPSLEEPTTDEYEAQVGAGAEELPV